MRSLRGKLLVDVWVDEEAVIGDAVSDRVYRITVWREVDGEVDVDGPTCEPYPGLHSRTEAEVLAHRVERRLRRRRRIARVATERADDVRRRVREEGWDGEGERGCEEDRCLSAVSSEVVCLEGGRPIPGWDS